MIKVFIDDIDNNDTSEFQMVEMQYIPKPIEIDRNNLQIRITLGVIISTLLILLIVFGMFTNRRTILK